MLATFDVEGLFTNIVHKGGLLCLQEQLQEDSTLEQAHKDYSLKLMELILKNNLFSFHDLYWRQLVGAAMGSKPIPDYADNFMARTIDPEIQRLAEKYDTNKVKSLPLLKRFLDDYISLFVGTTRNLHTLLEDINKTHPKIRLTMSHTPVPGEPIEDQCKCEKVSEIPFLDTLCSIKEGKIETDLYKKPTDRNQYLLPTSCHPKQTTKSIPKSIGLRIIRVCSDPLKRDQRLSELKIQLLERGYSEEMLDRSIDKVKKIPREAALREVIRPKETNRPVFPITYDPRLPSVTSILSKHWRSMASRDKHLKEVFPAPPLTAYKKQPNIRSYLVRAALPKQPNRYPQRNQKGMSRCNKANCTSCPYIKEGKGIKINEESWTINRKLDCNSYNIVYAIICKKEACRQVYIGETKRILKFRLADHRGYVLNKQTNQATGHHFNLPGHSLSDLQITAIEQVRKNDVIYRRQREEYHIRRFNTLHQGINKKI